MAGAQEEKCRIRGNMERGLVETVKGEIHAMLPLSRPSMGAGGDLQVARHDDTRPVSFLPLGQGLGTTKSDGGVPQSRIAEETMGILKHVWMGGAP